jgi:hypothetical protein
LAPPPRIRDHPLGAERCSRRQERRSEIGSAGAILRGGHGLEDLAQTRSIGGREGSQEGMFRVVCGAGAIGEGLPALGRSVQFLVTAGAGQAPIQQRGLPDVGDPAVTRDLLLQFIDAGVRHLVLAPVASSVDRPARWLADEIVGPLLEQVSDVVGA